MIKFLDNLNPINYLVEVFPIPIFARMVSQRYRQKRLCHSLIRKHENMIYAFELNQRICNAEIETLRKMKDEKLKKAEEVEEAIKEKMKLPKVDMDEIKKEQKGANLLRREAGTMPREKEDFIKEGNPDSGIKFHTIPEMIAGQEHQIQDQLQEIGKNQMTVDLLKKEMAKL